MPSFKCKRDEIFFYFIISILNSQQIFVAKKVNSPTNMRRKKKQITKRDCSNDLLLPMKSTMTLIIMNSLPSMQSLFTLNLHWTIFGGFIRWFVALIWRDNKHICEHYYNFDAFIIFVQKIHNLIFFPASCWIIQHEINLHKLKQKFMALIDGEEGKKMNRGYFTMSIFYEKFGYIDWLEFRMASNIWPKNMISNRT